MRAILTASSGGMRHVPGFDAAATTAEKPPDSLGSRGDNCGAAAGRHNIREQDTPDHMAFLAERMAGEEIIVSGVDSMIIFSFQKMT